MGEEGYVVLVRQGGRIEGIQVVYYRCTTAESRKRRLHEALGRELRLKEPHVETPYEIFRDDSLVHFALDPHDDTCTLTIAGPRFGKVFKASQIRSGLRGLGGAMRPR